jgi:hypothetical protein
MSDSEQVNGFKELCGSPFRKSSYGGSIADKILRAANEVMCQRPLSARWQYCSVANGVRCLYIQPIVNGMERSDGQKAKRRRTKRVA